MPEVTLNHDQRLCSRCTMTNNLSHIYHRPGELFWLESEERMQEHYIQDFPMERGMLVSVIGGVLFLQEMRNRDPFQRAVPCWSDSHPLRKTETEWVLRSNYGYGWEDESAAETWIEMRQLLKEYRENAPQGQYRAVKRSVVKAQYQN